jgi:uncharacterized protein (TIGR00730 family)
MSKKLIHSEKAYKNLEFLNSPDARAIRLLSEFLEPMRRFRHQNVKDTIVFFGSARIKSRREALQNLRRVRSDLKTRDRSSTKSTKLLAEAEIDLETSRYYEDAAELSRKLTLWSKRMYRMNRFVVCSGGGPGIMEAANKGAALAKGRSIGLNISLPFEQFPNRYVSRNLDFVFHYFFMRKFWFVYLAKALVMFPGGFGTFDELMEVLTLLQTKKIKKKVTVVLYSKGFWDKVFNFSELLRMHLISDEDLKLFKFANTPDEAYSYLVKEIGRNYPAEDIAGRIRRR